MDREDKVQKRALGIQLTTMVLYSKGCPMLLLAYAQFSRLMLSQEHELTGPSLTESEMTASEQIAFERTASELTASELTASELIACELTASELSAGSTSCSQCVSCPISKMLSSMIKCGLSTTMSPDTYYIQNHIMGIVQQWTRSLNANLE